MATEDLRLVHLRIPKRLIDQLDHYARKILHWAGLHRDSARLASVNIQGLDRHLYCFRCRREVWK